MQKGLVIVFTGNGKGKTSAALGVALRACGHKMYVSMIQFIKRSSNTGEAAAAERLVPEFEFMSMGKGFVGLPDSATTFEEHKKAAVEALSAARQRINSGSWDVVILDEINTAVKLGLLDINEVLEIIKHKPSKLHIILTGRDASGDLISLADMVTEMKEIKHPYNNGTIAQKGIDY